MTTNWCYNSVILWLGSVMCGADGFGVVRLGRVSYGEVWITINICSQSHGKNGGDWFLKEMAIVVRRAMLLAMNIALMCITKPICILEMNRLTT